MANTAAQNYDAALLNVSALIVQVTASPNPSYSINGQSISKSEYLRMLIDSEFTLNQARQRADGPFEIRSIGRS